MQIITTHINTDMDALASMVAVQKLYPGAVMVLPGKLSQSVEEFMSLHKDTLNVKTVKEISQEPVERIILVDTKSPGRVAELNAIFQQPGVEVHIFDHHPRSTGDIAGTMEVVEMVGAATTLLVEKIRQRGLKLTSIEATILALGIYQDTGSLVFSGTTVRDVEAVAYLLANGANLAVVAEFLDRPFSDSQRVLLKNLLVSSEHVEINGIRLLIAKSNVDEFVNGLAILTHKLADFERPDAVFTVVEMEDRVHVVARSNVPEVDVREIMGAIGGGGHPAAASATIKKARVDQVAGKLMELIQSMVRPPVTASSIMSTPVKIISPDTVIAEAGQVMLRYGHSGLPVVKDGSVVGIVSRRDVDKAVHHGLGHAPVKGFMTNNPVFVGPQVSAQVVQDLMIEHDIGRLPVIEDGRLLGIITRSDVLRTLHGGSVQKSDQAQPQPGRKSANLPYNIKELMHSGLSVDYYSVLERAGKVAAELNYKLYAAGGVVRDLLLGNECLDIDLVVEGDGIALAQALSEEYGGRLRAHPQFGTATVFFPNGLQVDVATARVEFYQYPAAMPQVETSTLHQDLYRRDFTINAMAVSLNEASFGDVVDFFGGRADLERGMVRVLHNLSFIEDPMRILRALRFEKRYFMNLEPQTLKLVREAVNNKMLARVSGERLWEEIKHIFREPRPSSILDRAIELNLWDFLFPGVVPEPVRPVLSKISRSIKTLQGWNLLEPFESWLVYFLAVLHAVDWTKAAAICRRYNLSKRYTVMVAAALGGWGCLRDNLQEPLAITYSELARQVLLLPREAYPLILCYLTGSAPRRRFRKVLSVISCNKPLIKGEELRELGYKPGPLYKKALDALWQARLDGDLCTRQEEMSFVKEYLGKYEER
ncbi:MAG: CCA-adding enzyme [Pelotomaculum sp. PtaB.Bin104]|nr:MAG: CCA-adding enzyme [Pelotomaculum sp. PtaB.Bin104]